MKKKNRRAKPFCCPWSNYKCDEWWGVKDAGRRYFRIGSLTISIHNPSRGISSKMSKAKNEWRVTLQDEKKYVKLFALTDRAWPNRAAAMKAVRTVVRQLLVIAPAMVSTKTEHGCEVTWPFDPASEPRFIEIEVRGYR
jgi:hypothetical protein